MTAVEVAQWGFGVVALLLTVALGFVWKWYSIRTYWMLLQFPSISRFPIIGDTIHLASFGPEGVLQELHRIADFKARYLRAILLGIPCIQLYHPDDIEVVLGGTTNIKKGFEYFALKSWLGEGLLLSHGNKWHQRRKLLTPTFHFRILEDNVGQIAGHTNIFVQKLLETNGKPTDIEDMLRQYTLDVICETAMGVKLDAQKNGSPNYVEAIKRASLLMVKRVMELWLMNDTIYSFTKEGKKTKQDLKIIHTFTEEVIKNRRVEKADDEEEKGEDGKYRKRKAFLDILLEEEKINPGSLSPLDIREEVDTFMFEGHDTTSSAIIHAIYSLAHNPDVQGLAFEEQERIFGTDKRDPTRQDLQEMVYLEMVIKEVLRLFPSVPYISRTALKDTTIADGKVIPAGTNVIVMPYVLHRNEDYWDNPEEFRPERFLPGINRHPYAYLPFSAGPRNCIGMKFAMLELKTTLSSIIRSCQIFPVTKELHLEPILILRNNVPIKIRIVPRET